MARMAGIFDFWRKKEAPRGSVPVGEDLYAVLELDQNATPDQIRSAYRKLGALYHPDRNPGNAAAYARFLEISRAHDVLSDPDKRARYDAALAAARGTTAEEPPGPRSLSTFRQEAPTETAERAKAAPKRAPGPPMPWDVLFEPSVDEEGRSRAIYEAFPGPPEPKPLKKAPWDVFFPAKVVVDMPSREKLIEGVQKLPLSAIWDFVRKYKTDPRFIETRSIVVGPVAGGGNSPVEYDLAALTNTSFDQIAAFAEQKGLSRAWNKILGPLAEQATLAIESLKPADIPGYFFMDWDPSGRMLELLYTEPRR